MEVIKILEEIEKIKNIKEIIVDAMHEKAIRIARKERDYKISLMKELLLLRDKKVPVVIINKVAEGNLSTKAYEIDVLKVEHRILREKLENSRQNLEVCRSLLKNERELL